MSEHPWHVSILVPAKDEEQLLPRCLRSVLTASAALRYPISTDIVVVADSSTDRTVQIATDLLQESGTVVTVAAGTVGAARAVAAETALARSRAPLHRCWLANTDADCIVPPTWLIDQCRLADQGIEAIAGTVSVDSFDEHGPDVADRFRASYIIAPDGSHQHIHGANIGVRADLYLAAGGWAHLNTAEDHHLWRCLKRIGALTASTARVEVVTSGRRVGRAPHGFAGALAAHNEAVV